MEGQAVGNITSQRVSADDLDARRDRRDARGALKRLHDEAVHQRNSLVAEAVAMRNAYLKRHKLSAPPSKPPKAAAPPHAAATAPEPTDLPQCALLSDLRSVHRALPISGGELMYVAFDHDVSLRGQAICLATGRTFYGAVAALPVPHEAMIPNERGGEMMWRWTDVILEGSGCAHLTVMRVQEDDHKTPQASCSFDATAASATL
jgi:hypothetical protein